MSGTETQLLRVCQTCKHLIGKFARRLGPDSAPADAPRTHGLCGPCYIAGATCDEDYVESLCDLIDDVNAAKKAGL